MGCFASKPDNPRQGVLSCWRSEGSPALEDTARDPAQHTEDEGALKERDRPLADSAEESPYIHPASKTRFGSHKGNGSGHQQLDTVSYSPNDVLEPRHASLLSDFGSDSDSDDESDWDKFSSGEGSNETSEALAERKARTVEARKRETSLFGVTDKRLSAPLKETSSLKLAKLRGCTFVNQYVVIKYLGRGACGRVFLCMDMTDNRLYAVKIVKKVELEAQRAKTPGEAKAGRRRRNPVEDLKREVAIMRTLRHKNIVSLQEVVDDPTGNKMLLVMDYMEGGPVMTRDALEKGRCIPESLALQYFRDMCKALDYLHYHKVVHGDLKPENVLMSARGNVTLSDFGCSKVIMSGNEYLERCNGTPAFLAPEMMRPHSRYRGRPTDIYALGACLYTFVFGRIPFNAPSVFKLFQVVQHEPLRFPTQPQVSHELRDLLLRMLAKNPKERITLGKMMKHPWVTRRGSWPLRTVKEMVRMGDTPELPPVLPDLMSTLNVLDIPRQDHLTGVLRPGLPERAFEDGELLLRQGEQGTFMMYILEGQAEVTVRLQIPRDGSNNARVIQSRHMSRPMEHEEEGDARSEAGNRQPRGDVIGDDLPPALIEGASKAHDFANNLSRGPREYLVAVRSEGQFIGEMALFAVAAVRCASVRAKGPVRVKIVPGESLEELIDMAPEARQQVQEMVWMKQSENMVLEAMTRLSTVHDALEELLMGSVMSRPQTADSNTVK
ncbi:hypothetical protein WJX82_004325 [Trebouxia sp. C0006]